MGPGTDRPIPVGRPVPVDPRTKAGAFGEGIRGPHKPTLDEMGPHASLAVKKATGPLPKKPDLSSRPSERGSASAEPGPGRDSAQPQKPSRTLEFDDPAEQKRRKGRPRKTGRPGA
jgi:excinuclease ABC subunit B